MVIAVLMLSHRSGDYRLMKSGSGRAKECAAERAFEGLERHRWHGRITMVRVAGKNRNFRLARASVVAMSSDEADADRFRRQAMICREEAAKAGSPEDAASWLRLAEDFEERAQQLHCAIKHRLAKLKPS
jgi:hypothetical protein